jgi:hypothetical protein
MSVTSNNRRLSRDIRKKLACIVRETNGVLNERKASGGRIISNYEWNTTSGKKGFSISWHSSVSDRYFPKTIMTEIKRKLGTIPGLSFTVQPKALPNNITVDDAIISSSDNTTKFFRDTGSPEQKLLTALEMRVLHIERAQNEKRLLHKMFEYIDAWLNWRIALKMYRNGTFG